MASKYSVSLDKLIKEFGFETLYLPEDAHDLSVTSQDVNRPGLILAGRDDYFDPERVQFLGLSEIEFLKTLSDEMRYESLKRLVQTQPPFILITRNLEIPSHLSSLVEEYKVPLLRTGESTSSCMSALISFLGTELAERITRHGVLVEVYGEGVLIFGDSGIGKSETAIELVKRGHRLVADDAVELRKVSNRQIKGTAPENIRHFIELRGIGVIDVQQLFGMRAVMPESQIDLVVEFEPWDSSKAYDRLGIEDRFIDILGKQVPCVTLPIRPGRNLASIVEVAAMNNRHKKMGYNAALEFTKQINEHFDQAMSAQAQRDL